MTIRIIIDNAGRITSRKRVPAARQAVPAGFPSLDDLFGGHEGFAHGHESVIEPANKGLDIPSARRDNVPVTNPPSA